MGGCNGHPHLQPDCLGSRRAGREGIAVDLAYLCHLMERLGQLNDLMDRMRQRLVLSVPVEQLLYGLLRERRSVRGKIYHG